MSLRLKSIVLYISFFLFFTVNSFAQLVVSSTMTPNQIAQSLAGQGITISNVTVNCPPSTLNEPAYGWFDGTNSNIGLNAGLLMTTGTIANAIGPNNSNGSLVLSNNNPGDPLLNSLVGGLTTYDACVYTFTLEPAGDTLTFNYVFASEEYPEFAPPNNSAYNDVFGFFITGPDPSGGNYTNYNVARINNNTTIVSINNINAITNSQFYVSNGNGAQAPQNTDPTVVQYDGFTTVLQAIVPVIPCQPYVLRFAIADVGDGLYNSGVFIEAGSISTNAVTIETTTSVGFGFQNAIEGCVDGIFNLILNNPSIDTTIIDLVVGGTAINGTDYATIPSQVIFYPGDSVATIVVQPFQDGISEPLESVVLSLINSCNGLVIDSAMVYIQDSIELLIAGPDQVIICQGDQVLLSASGTSNYSWTPATGLSDPNIPNPVAQPVTTTTYVVTSTMGTCVKSDSVTIAVNPQDFTLDAGPDQQICLNENTQINLDIQPPGNYTINWSPAAGLSSSTAQNPFASPTDTTQYIVEVISPAGCRQYDTVLISVAGVAPSVMVTISPDTVCPGGTVQLEISTIPQTCGISASACSTPVQQFTVGTNSLTSNITTPYRGVWEDSRVTYLYTAAELQAQGFSGGKIQEIAFDVSTKSSSAPYGGFTIKMGCTSLTALTGYVPGLTTVFNAKPVTTTTGWNNHVLDAAYDWDGVSNILVEICFDNSTWTSSDYVRYTGTTFNSVAHMATDGSPGCLLSAPAMSTNRPNIRLSGCSGTSLAGTSITWSSIPNSVINNPNSASTYATIYFNTTFLAEVDDGNGCVGSDVVNAFINNDLTISAGPDTTVCGGSPVQLSATATGTPGPISLTCGVNSTPCPSPSNFTLGSGVTSTSSPTPYAGNTKARMQFLYRASELTAAGIQTGVISALAFDVAGDNSAQAFQNMRISMGCTNATTLTDYVTGLSTVYTAASVNTTTGWNTHNLSTTFDWDGFSNIIVEVCYENANSPYSAGGGNDLIRFTSTTYNSVIFTADPFEPGSGCNFSTIPFITVNNGNRPNIRFSMCPPPPGQFSYSWSPSTGLSDSTLQDPIANPATTTSYIVTVTDGTCIAMDTVTINIGASFNVDLHGDSIACAGGSGLAWAVPSGGNGPYTFSWQPGGFNTDTIIVTQPGDYNVTVADVTGCSRTDTVSVFLSNAAFIDSISATHVTCSGANDGTATVFPSGGNSGYTFAWSSGALTATATNLQPGWHTVSVSDNAGCTATDSVEILELQSITLSILTTDVSCNMGSDGTAVVVATGGTGTYTYLWSNGDLTAMASGFPAGPVWVQVTDGNGCTASDTVLINEPAPIAYTVNTVDVSCFGSNDGSAEVIPTGGMPPYSFSWLGSPVTSALLTGLVEGTYNFSFTDSAGCLTSGTAVINEPPLFEVTTDNSPVTMAGASDGSAWIAGITGGVAPYTWIWSNGMNDPFDTISGLTPGNYCVTVTDVNGCTATSCETVIEPGTFIITLTSTNPACNGVSTGSVSVTVSGGLPPFSYSWNTGDTTATVNNLPEGVYTVTVSDLTGFTVIDSVSISAPPALQVDLITHTDVNCFGGSDGSATIAVSGGTPGYSYLWSSGDTTATASGLTAGTYVVTATDFNGCFIVDSVDVTEPPILAFSSSVTPVSCYNGSDGTATVTVTSPGTFTYQWSNGDTTSTADSLVAGFHIFGITDSNGCTAIDTVFIAQPSEIQFTTAVINISCNGASDGIAYVETLIGGTGVYTYEWTGGSTSDTLSGLAAGTYDVTVTDSVGCFRSKAITISEPAPMTVTVVTEPESCFNYQNGSAIATVSGGNTPYTFDFSAGTASANTVSGLSAGSYAVIVTDANGCESIDSFVIGAPDSVVLQITHFDESCPNTADGMIYAEASGGTGPYWYSLQNGSSNAFGNFKGLTGGTYIVTATDANGCTISDTVQIIGAETMNFVYIPRTFEIQLGDSVQFFPTITPPGFAPTATFIWEPPTGLNCFDCPDPVASPYSNTVYNVTMTFGNGCIAVATVFVDVVNPMQLFVPNAFSPNGDDKNDAFRLYGKNFDNVDLIIYNRWGEKIAHSSGIEASWDGVLQTGEIAQAGVYLYVAEITYIDGQKTQRSGSITILR